MALQNPVAIYTASSNAHAEEVRLLLAHCGVEAYVTEDLSVVGVWVGGTLPGIHTPKVWVDRSEAQRAAELIEEYEFRVAERFADESDGDDDSEQAEDDCLACGEFIPEESDRCPACGWTYGAEAGDD